MSAGGQGRQSASASRSCAENGSSDRPAADSFSFLSHQSSPPPRVQVRGARKCCCFCCLLSRLPQLSSRSESPPTAHESETIVGAPPLLLPDKAVSCSASPSLPRGTGRRGWHGNRLQKDGLVHVKAGMTLADCCATVVRAEDLARPGCPWLGRSRLPILRLADCTEDEKARPLE